MAEVYKFQYEQSSVYGHVVALLSRYGVAGNDGVHLDIGCGYGAIAEHVVAETGVIYVGVDGSHDGLASIRARGFEAHHHTFNTNKPVKIVRVLKDILAGRELRSISCIDMLEHVPDPRVMLDAFRMLVGQKSIPLVTSVPNVAHYDVGMKLLFGQFESTDVGILDRTHVTHFTDRSLRDLLSGAGWQQADANDVPFALSDQHFPLDHPGFSGGSLLARRLRQIRHDADAFGHINQLVRLSLPREPVAARAEPAATTAPFLSVIMASDGTDIDSVRDVLVCLSVQFDQDFEFLLVGYDLICETHRALVEALEWHAEPMRARGRFLRCNWDGRINALNFGLLQANGAYGAVVEAGTTLSRRWVERFHALAMQHFGKVVGVQGDRAETADLHSVVGDRSIPSLRHARPDERKAGPEHLLGACPGAARPAATFAFPLTLARYQQQRFNPDLIENHHLDFVARNVALCGLAEGEAATVTAPTRAAANAREFDKLRAGLDDLVFLVQGDELRRLAALDSGRAEAQGGPDRTFLSVVVVSREVSRAFNHLLLCLANQADADFEVLVMARDGHDAADLRALVRNYPLAFSRKVRVRDASGASDAAAFNAALGFACGKYVVLAHNNEALPKRGWVAALRALDSDAADRILHIPVARGRSDPADMARQLAEDCGPGMAYAFPLAAVRERGLRYDEMLPRLFKWDFRVRALGHFGLRCSRARALVGADPPARADDDELRRLRNGFAHLSLPLPVKTFEELSRAIEQRDEHAEALRKALDDAGARLHRLGEENAILERQLAAQKRATDEAVERNLRQGSLIDELQKPKGLAKLMRMR